MINLPVIFKKACLTAVIVLFAVSFTDLHAQKLEVKYKIDSLLSGKLKEYNVSVSINHDNKPYKYSLFEGLPYKKRIIEDKEYEIRSSFIIKGLLPKKTYFLVVQPLEDEEMVEIKAIKIP